MIAHYKRLLIEWMTNPLSILNKNERCGIMFAICIRNTHYEEQLTIGRRYKIIKYNMLKDGIYIKCNDGVCRVMSVNRFKFE
jgi:hypothetical protein